MFLRRKMDMVEPERALPGRSEALPVAAAHTVLGTPMTPPFPEGTRTLLVALGCFWGAERLFWTVPGVVTTAVGYVGGFTPNPTYEEVCSGRTGHAEAVLVAYDPEQISLEALLKVFWEGHDPTQGMAQGNDTGTQYRSGVYGLSPDERAVAEASRDAFQEQLHAAGHGDITTEITDGGPFFYAEDEHQQYLDKNPHGYCGLGGLAGVSCPIGLTTD
ncbi:MAG TPA: peptide-methionine (S)-S-oxide reductase MsrA [Acidimicrobiales bacterium]|nr:peptide-methionine (S)-S-oxide reductase MsrA [Acidimicrobiales bacterium]